MKELGTKTAHLWPFSLPRMQVGTHFADALKTAKDLSELTGQPIHFEFNGDSVTVDKTVSYEIVLQEFWKQHDTPEEGKQK
jgi:hypothetical protein